MHGCSGWCASGWCASMVRWVLCRVCHEAALIRCEEGVVHAIVAGWAASAKGLRTGRVCRRRSALTQPQWPGRYWRRKLVAPTWLASTAWSSGVRPLRDSGGKGGRHAGKQACRKAGRSGQHAGGAREKVSLPFCLWPGKHWAPRSAAAAAQRHCPPWQRHAAGPAQVVGGGGQCRRHGQQRLQGLDAATLHSCMADRGQCRTFKSGCLGTADAAWTLPTTNRLPLPAWAGVERYSPQGIVAACGAAVRSRFTHCTEPGVPFLTVRNIGVLPLMPSAAAASGCASRMARTSRAAATSPSTAVSLRLSAARRTMGLASLAWAVAAVAAAVPSGPGAVLPLGHGALSLSAAASWCRRKRVKTQ